MNCVECKRPMSLYSMGARDNVCELCLIEKANARLAECGAHLPELRSLWVRRPETVEAGSSYPVDLVWAVVAVHHDPHGPVQVRLASTRRRDFMTLELDRFEAWFQSVNEPIAERVPARHFNTYAWAPRPGSVAEGYPWLAGEVARVSEGMTQRGLKFVADLLTMQQRIIDRLDARRTVPEESLVTEYVTYEDGEARWKRIPRSEIEDWLHSNKPFTVKWNRS